MCAMQQFALDWRLYIVKRYKHAFVWGACVHRLENNVLFDFRFNGDSLCVVHAMSVQPLICP